MNDAPSIALVHDYLLTMRGAERSFARIAEIWPDAPIYTSVADRDQVAGWFDGHAIETTWLQRLGAGQQTFRRLLPLYPRAFRGIDLSGFDAVVSSSSAFAHYVKAPAGRPHVCYCYTPFRYAWHERERGIAETPRPLRKPMNAYLERLRRADVAASAGVTDYVAISDLTRQRIADAYSRDSTVIYPPVDTDRFGAPAESEDFMLFVGEVVSHKRVEVAIEAAEKAGKRIKIVGSGPERAALSVKYADTAEFTGRITDDELNGLLARCAALIVPNVEEFGIAAVEAQAAGRPVVAIDQGGTSETVIDGETGVLVPTGTVEEFAEAIRANDFHAFDPGRAQANAARFSASEFRRRFGDHVRRVIAGD